MPFGDYDDFADCVAKNQDKPNPEAFCAWLHHKIIGKWPSEKESEGGETKVDVKKLLEEAEKTLGELKEAATIKSKLQSLLKAAEALLEDKTLSDKIRDDIREIRSKLLKRWSELAAEETEHKESTITERGVIQESTPTNGRVPIVIISAGPGNPKDNHYYPIDTLARDYKLFEGRKMYVDHPTISETRERPERSLRDWVATVRNVSYNSRKNEMEGYAEIHSDWFGRLVEVARDGIGISINAMGSTRKGDIYDRTWNIVDQIVAVNSVDFVTEAGAGGRIKALYESLRKEETDMDLKTLTLEQLKEARKDLVEAIRKEEKPKDVEQIAQLIEKNKTLEAKLVEVSASLVLRDIAEATKTLVAATDLPEAAKARVAASMNGSAYISATGQVDTAKLTEAVKVAVTAEKDYLAKIIESGKIRHPGGANQSEIQLKEARKAMWKQLGYNDDTIKKMEEVKP